MANIFLISDTHFGHTGVCQFMRSDGITKLRPWNSAEEMDEALVKNWNNTVSPLDKVYHLGDVVINRKALKTLERLNGTKVLIRGNHDIFRLEEYTPYFKDLRGYHVLDNMLLSHIPVHSDSKGRFKANIHGHLHDKHVRSVLGFSHKLKEIIYSSDPDPWYYNVSVERINYTPVPLEVVKASLSTCG